MIRTKEEAVNALQTVASTLDSLGGQGGMMCFRVGNAYMACLDLNEYLKTIEDPKPEDDPPEEDPADDVKKEE